MSKKLDCSDFRTKDIDSCLFVQLRYEQGILDGYKYVLRLINQIESAEQIPDLKNEARRIYNDQKNTIRWDYKDELDVLGEDI